MNIKEIRERAKLTLYSRGNMLKLVLLGILLMAAVMLPILLYEYVGSLIFSIMDLGEDERFIATIPSGAIAGAVFALITLPMISGVYTCGAQIYEGEREDHMAAFGSEYTRHLCAGAMLVLRWIPAIVILVAAMNLPQFIVTELLEIESGYSIDTSGLYSMLAEWGLMALFLVVALAVTFCILMLSGGMFLFPYFITRGYKTGEARMESRRIMRLNRGLNRRFLGSFAGLLALSVVSLGLLFVFYVLPLMLMTYYELAARLESGETVIR